jgi:hypothetical protein
VFDDRVERRKFALKRDEVIGGWRKVHNKDLPNSYYSWYIRIMKSKLRLAAYVVCMSKKRSESTILVSYILVSTILVESSEGKNQ